MGLDNPVHLALLAVILLLLFGAKRLPEIGRSLGGGLREFKQSINGNGTSQSHDQQPPTLSAGTPPATEQSPFAQREPTATDQR
jgi:sec-independent protein translocase protein TatA